MCVCKVPYPVQSGSHVFDHLQCVSEDKVHLWITGHFSEGLVDVPLLPHGSGDEGEDQEHKEKPHPLHNMAVGEPLKQT